MGLYQLQQCRTRRRSVPRQIFLTCLDAFTLSDDANQSFNETGSQAAGGNGNLIAVVGGICGSSVAPCNVEE